MWTILEDHDLAKQLAKGTPLDILKRYEKWKDIVRFSGPEGLKLVRGFRDEALVGGWRGYRSSRLSLQWRVIYRVEAQAVSVFVEKVTAHDYARAK
jgi:addiction module RelE/StbE family toxin